MTAYYNEIEPYAAEWLRNLIAAGHIAPGVVDTRSIEDVHPADLKDFTQCHFFAGVGVWSLALRRAGWSDDRPVWTGSCPCQPFSAAGQGAGFTDERHLWPAFHHLIRQRRPAVVLGEQVASKDVEPWIDLVQDDMEGVGYRFGAVPFPSAGVGAPHIRDRLYWVADAAGPGSQQQCRDGREPARRAKGSGALWLANSNGGARGQGSADLRGRADGGDAQSRPGSGGGIVLGGLGHTNHRGLQGEGLSAQRRLGGDQPGAQWNGETGVGDNGHDGRSRNGPAADAATGPTNGYWRDADWLGCRDGKWRPVEPGTFPLAHGATSRVGRLRAYGNAINAEAARVFVEAVMEAS